MWPYITATTCPSDCLLHSSDQSSRDGGEMKAGCARGLGDSSSDQSGANGKGICEMHFGGYGRYRWSVLIFIKFDRLGRLGWIGLVEDVWNE